MSNQQPIVIVGAGVIGLSTAVILQQRQASPDITIIAAEFPPCRPFSIESQQPAHEGSADFASMWAGAHYRPTPGSTEQLKSESELCALTGRIMRQIARKEPESGVQTMQGVEYFDTPSDEVLSLKPGHNLTGSHSDGFRILSTSELPTGVQHGYEYQTYCLNPPMYTRWLLNRFTSLGGKTIQQKLTNVTDAFKVYGEQGPLAAVPVVINCSGRNFDQDSRTNIIRGQTVLVRNQYHRTVTRQHRDGKWSFLIPRPFGGGTIVGGTKEMGDAETEPRPATRRELLTRAAENFPDFVRDPADFDVIKDVVGRRPWRDGGMRIELETLPNGRTVIHGYGAGGRGYEMSWGAAAKIARLVKTFEAQKAKL